MRMPQPFHVSMKGPTPVMNAKLKILCSRAKVNIII
jgi:hypothetical protein